MSTQPTATSDASDTPPDAPWTRVYRPGTGPDGPVWITARYSFGRLSITGVEGPMANGNARGPAGQCRDALQRITTYSPGWDAAQCAELAAIWDRWHLNDMRAGSPAQQSYLREHPVTDRQNYYTAARKALAVVGLHPDPNHRGRGEDGYRYGEAWLREDVPADVLSRLLSFDRGTAREHPWGRLG